MAHECRVCGDTCDCDWTPAIEADTCLRQQPEDCKCLKRHAETEKDIESLRVLVGSFGEKMIAKLDGKAREGWSGWDGDAPGDRAMFERKLVDHAVRAIHGEKGQWVDVANFAAFLDGREGRSDGE